MSALFPLVMQKFQWFISQICHYWCPPFSAGDATFLFICFQDLSLLVSALFRWPCSIFSRSVNGAAFLFIYFLSLSILTTALFRWPFSVGDAIFLFICFPALSLLVSAFFRWPCSISIHWFPRSVIVGVALFRWRCNISIHLFPRSVTPGVRPCPLAMQHFYLFVSQVCQWCSISIHLL